MDSGRAYSLRFDFDGIPAGDEMLGLAMTRMAEALENIGFRLYQTSIGPSVTLPGGGDGNMGGGGGRMDRHLRPVASFLNPLALREDEMDAADVAALRARGYRGFDDPGYGTDSWEPPNG